MKFEWKPRYIWIGGTLLTFTAVGWYFSRQYKLLNESNILPADFVPNKLTTEEADINIKLQLDNKSSTDYWIRGQLYDIFLNGTKVGTITNPNKIYVAPNKKTDIWLNIKFNPNKIKGLSWQILKDLILKSSNVKIRIRGHAKISMINAIVSFNYPVDEIFTIKDLTTT